MRGTVSLGYSRTPKSTELVELMMREFRRFSFDFSHLNQITKLYKDLDKKI